MDRRKFITISTSSLFLAACGSNSDKTPTSQPPTKVESELTEQQWQQLVDSIDGDVILPTNTSAYATARLVFHTRYDHIYPQAIVHCKNDSDVKSILEFVQLHSLALTPRCGSHSYIGNSTSKGVIIDVSKMNHISVSQNRANIGAGARLVDVYDQLTQQGVCIPLGTCLSVGIAGLTLGGGFGIVDRQYGLTCDALVGAKIITADGQLLTCSEEQNQDLFWALRGGGGGNLGVVTEFIFETHDISDIIHFSATFHFSDFSAVMSEWQTLADLWPNEMWAQCLPSWINGALRLQVRAFCLNDLDSAVILWEEFISRIGRPTLTNSHWLQTYRSTMLGSCMDAIAECRLSAHFPEGEMQRSAFAASSDFFNDTIPFEGLETLEKHIQNLADNGKYGMIIFNLMAGKISDIAPDETAFPHRLAKVSAEYYAPLASSAPVSRIDESQVWNNEFRQLMAPWSSGGAYVNYLDPLIDNWQNAYYGNNYARLTTTKNQYDPNSLFNIKQGIET